MAACPLAGTERAAWRVSMPLNPLTHDLISDHVVPGEVLESRTQRPDAAGLALAHAILLRAIMDVQYPRTLRGHSASFVHGNARRWFFSNDRSYLFSFVNICELLGLSAATLRQRVAGLAPHDRRQCRTVGRDRARARLQRRDDATARAS